MTGTDGTCDPDTLRQIGEGPDFPDEVRIAAANELELDRSMSAAIIASASSLDC